MRVRYYFCAFLVVFLTAFGLAACGGGSHHQQHQQFKSVPANCHYAPPKSAHALAAKEGLACPSSKLKLGPVKLSGLVEMDDSTDLGPLLGTNYPAYAGYVDGLYRSYPDIYGHFHPLGKETVGIDVDGGRARDVDLEPSPNAFQNNAYSAGGWAHDEIANTSNKRPMIYTMGSWQGDIENSLAQWGIPRCSTPTQQGCYLEWIAVWDGNPVLYNHMACHQFIDHGPNGENRDRSVCDASMVFSASADPRLAQSYNWGYANGMGSVYRTGYSKDHKISTYSGAQFNAGFNAGFNHAYKLGIHASSVTVSGTTYNSCFNFGFRSGYAVGADRPYYTGWIRWYHKPTSNRTAYNTGYNLGVPKGFNWMFNSGYEANKKK